ncbi:MAG: HAD-IC family P-type ATPase, partial [Burkholderiaceae bacterium]|nr:HAD-IC family P-type ATPase [Burkholderiaceae bacterium]
YAPPDAPTFPVSDFISLTGKGIQGTILGDKVVLGNAQMLREADISIDEIKPTADNMSREGQTVLFLGVNRELVGLISVTDPIRPDTPEAIRLLRDGGLRILMLTGDNAATAQSVAARLKLDAFQAEVLPEDKFNRVAALQEQGHIVAMAGDGINDAPALAKAHVGISMGNGTDIAISNAQVVLVKGDLRGIAKARQLSQHTMRNIRQNLFFAFAYNLVCIPVAAGVFYPWFGILLSPMIASAAMSVSSVSVIANALRLRRASIHFQV